MKRESIEEILAENRRRHAERERPFDPITGEGSLGERTRVEISDFGLPVQWLPREMAVLPIVEKIARRGSIAAFLREDLGVEATERERAKTADILIRLRMAHDFAFWAASVVKIKNKEGGDDVLFRLRRPQRLLAERFEQRRLAGEPIRLILLKARQWGGSTTTQLYMAWLQLWHKRGLNSLIIAHQGSASDEIKDMFDRMIAHYPAELLHEPGEPWSPDEAKLVGVGKSGLTHRIPQRNCKIKIGTAERPDGCRGGDYSLVHLSEVGIWKKTEGKSPEDIVRSACSGVLLQPLTMIVMESTANGTGNFFHTEYEAAAREGVRSQFEALFIPWYEIEQNTLRFAGEAEERAYARRLLELREQQNALSAREEPGRYLWSLWQRGATLEAINWYEHERAGKNEHAVMASEYPSDDVEAFVHSGTMVFDRYRVEELAADCREPRLRGEMEGERPDGPGALEKLRFREDRQGSLEIWEEPEPTDEGSEEKVADRYLTVVDVGGRGERADWSVIAVFDRLNMIDGDRPALCAQWRGHIDIDRLAWKAAQVAKWYDDALLVIESNTLETHDRERQIEGGDQSLYILNQIAPLYPNLYARRQSEDEIRQGLPRKYGFHTNTATKPMVITTLVKMIREHLYTERDRRCIDEMLTYERKPNGSYGAIAGRHDDLLMTRAIGLHICYYEMERPRIVSRGSRRLTKKAGPASEAVF